MRQLLVLLLSFILVQLHAQTDKNFIIRTHFGGNFAHNDNLDANANNYGEKYRHVIFVASVGRKVKNNYYCGLGLSYGHSGQEINPNSDVPAITNLPGSVAQSYLNSLSTTHVISPLIFVQYFSTLSDKLVVYIDLYTKYEFNNNKTELTSYYPNTSNSTYMKGDEYTTEFKKQYINLGLQPGLRLNVFKSLGVEFKFGLINYQRKTHDSRAKDIEKRTSDFQFGFKSENWLIGFYTNL